MSTRAVRRKSEPENRSGLPREAYHHILCRPHTARTLARALGVSIATVARVLAELRRALEGEGAHLVSVKEGASWRYEVREQDKDPWKSDAFVRAIGFATQARRPRNQKIDDALYGRPGRTR